MPKMTDALIHSINTEILNATTSDSSEVDGRDGFVLLLRRESRNVSKVQEPCKHINQALAIDKVTAS